MRILTWWLCLVAVAMCTWVACMVGTSLVCVTLLRERFLFENPSEWLFWPSLVAILPALVMGFFAARARRETGPRSWPEAVGLLIIALVSVRPVAEMIHDLVITERQNPSLELHRDAGAWVFSKERGGVGSLVSFLGEEADIPEGWVLADGRSLSKKEHAKLYARIGDTYGTEGDTFKIPDYRGMTLLDFRLYRGGRLLSLEVAPVLTELKEAIGSSDIPIVYRNLCWLIRVDDG